MSKYLLPLLLFLSVSFGFNSSETARQNYSSSIKPIITPTPVESDKSELMTLDKTRVCQPCPPGVRPYGDFGCDYDVMIKVFAADSENKSLIYRYTVSGGRVIGEGADVIWDMDNAAPGNYQIRVDIEDKRKKQKRTEIKQIEIRAGGCIADCACPTLSVNPPEYSVSAGETIIFTANVSGGSGETITYDWTISDGEIIEGQGTPVIRVATNAEMAGKTVKAIVNIEGVCEVCPKTESASISIIKAKPDKN